MVFVIIDLLFSSWGSSNPASDAPACEEKYLPSQE
jgi:hypothetical protein